MKNKLKSDIFNYFLSIIIPGSINFFSIPLIKWFVGTEHYGIYALWYGGFLITISAVTGWLGISIIRFKSDFSENNFFYKHVLKIIFYLGILTAAIGFITVTIISKNILFALLYGAALFGAICQNSFNAISQANFFSRATVIAEAIRMISFLLTYVLLLLISRDQYLEKLFFALFISYLCSVLFHKRKNKISLRVLRLNTGISNQIFSYRDFFKFGMPLVFWYMFSSSVPYIDKVLVAYKFGYLVQGNYQAIFDLMYRTVGVLFSPVLMATFPYLSQLYNEGKLEKALMLIRKAVLMEALIMVLFLVAYFLGVGKIVLHLLGIREDGFLVVGAIILTVAFIWQMAMMLHKPFELMKKTNILLINNMYAFFATLVPLTIIYFSNLSFIAYPSGILCGALCYASLCIYQVKKIKQKGMD